MAGMACYVIAKMAWPWLTEHGRYGMLYCQAGLALEAWHVIAGIACYCSQCMAYTLAVHPAKHGCPAEQLRPPSLHPAWLLKFLSIRSSRGHPFLLPEPNSTWSWMDNQEGLGEISRETCMLWCCQQAPDAVGSARFCSPEPLVFAPEGREPHKVQNVWRWVVGMMPTFQQS